MGQHCPVHSLKVNKGKQSQCIINHHTMKTYREHSTILHILSLCTRWRCVASFMPQLYTTGEKASSTQSIGGRLRGREIQGQSQHSSDKQKNLCY